MTSGYLALTVHKDLWRSLASMNSILQDLFSDLLGYLRMGEGDQTFGYATMSFLQIYLQYSKSNTGQWSILS